jgi:trehalose 6-phosphate phosphatase
MAQGMRWYGFAKMQTLPPLTPRTALFLDFDGTLVDIAPRPDEIIVSPHVVATLQVLHDRLEGALAIISGRELPGIDSFLSPLVLPAAGEHGAQLRQADGTVTAIVPPDLFIVSRAASRLAVMHPTLLLETKAGAVALHFRQAPELEALCLETLTEAVSRSPGTELLRGKQVFEVKAMGVNKGRAIHTFMSRQPFAGRIPMFVGDDLTDEDGFAAVQQLGGHGLKVGDGPSQARSRCASPAALRAWLEQSAAALTQRAPA